MLSVILYRQQAPSKLVVDAFAAQHGGDVAPVDTQDLFVASVLCDGQLSRYPVEAEYTRRVLAEYIRRVDGRAEFSEALLAAYVPSGTEESSWYKTFTAGDTACSFRVGPQFKDVGRSVWPSALVLVNYLVEHPPSGPVSVLELGCGVGLTAMVCRHPAWARHTRRLVLTDYTEEVIDNVRHNLEINNFHNGGVVDAALLDWTQHEVNARLVTEWGASLIVAADVIYDVEVIDALATTIAQCMAAVPHAICIVAQTFRNDTSCDRFLTLLGAFCDVECVRPSAGKAVPVTAVEGTFSVDMANLTSILVLRRKAHE